MATDSSSVRGGFAAPGDGDDAGGRSIRLFGTWIQCPQAEHRKPKIGDERSPHLQQQRQQVEKENLDDGDAKATAKSASKNKGSKWTAEEHKAFLKGLAEKGKGNWKDISREFVKTRTSTQVMTHAQKYFLRQTKPLKSNNISLFDLTLESETKPQQPPLALPPSPPPSSAPQPFPVSRGEPSDLREGPVQLRVHPSPASPAASRFPLRRCR